MKPLVEPALFNAQLTRTMGACAYQGAEIGECLAIASQLKPGDKESWYTNWKLFADRNYKMGQRFVKKSLFSDAQSAFLRASNYYRTAFFFLEDNPEDDRIEKAIKKSTDAFLKASVYFNTSLKNISIPFENKINITGYLYLNTAKAGAKKPILIDTGGGDATKEETYFGIVSEAIKHGMHCLSIEGPGQGSILRLNKVPFIPDWERVITKVVDFVIKQPEVDEKKIYLLGRSFGGYLASRAVCYEKRIAACIVDPGIYDSTGNFKEKAQALSKAHPKIKQAPIYQIIEKAMEIDSSMRFMINSRKWRFGAKTVKELLENTQAYSLEGLVQNISCPMLVCDNTLEYLTLGQAKKIYNLLRCKKKYILFTPEEGAGGHCEPLYLQIFTARMFEWLKSLN